jgi:hypothetical protein
LLKLVTRDATTRYLSKSISHPSLTRKNKKTKKNKTPVKAANQTISKRETQKEKSTHQ